MSEGVCVLSYIFSGALDVAPAVDKLRQKQGAA